MPQTLLLQRVYITQTEGELPVGIEAPRPRPSQIQFGARVQKAYCLPEGQLLSFP